MANRRMFSLKIVDTDAFLDMPQTAQLLYYHLAMRADDDGFVDKPKRIMKTVGSGDDDMKVLVGKRFVIPFESGVCVIKHWRIHNLIRGDRYTPTTYLDEKKMLEVKENGVYTERKDVIPNGNHLQPQVRLGKDRLITAARVEITEEKDGEVIQKKESSAKYPDADKVFALWGKYPKTWIKNPNQRLAAQGLFEERGLEEVEDAIRWYEDLKDRPFCPQFESPYELYSKWAKFEKFVEKQEV